MDGIAPSQSKRHEQIYRASISTQKHHRKETFTGGYYFWITENVKALYAKQDSDWS